MKIEMDFSRNSSEYKHGEGERYAIVETWCGCVKEVSYLDITSPSTMVSVSV